MKIGIISDSPVLTTGYGVEVNYLAAELHRMGQQPVCLGLHQRFSGPEKDLPYPVVVPHAGSGPGFTSIGPFLVEHKPDVVLVDHALHTCRLVVDAIRDSGVRVPTLIWYTMEGAPPYKEWIRSVVLADRAVSHNRTGALEAHRVANIPVRWVPAAVDHSLFHPLERPERERIRQVLGWSGKFVVMFLGRNMWSKQQAILIEAMSLLRRREDRDILLYVHCKPFEQFREGGWDLVDLVNRMDLQDRVVFPDGLTDQRVGLPASGSLEIPGVAARYASADIFCSASAVEGFGLAILEAMASGLPVLHPDDGGTMNEISADAGWRIPVHDQYLIAWGSTYVKVSPRAVANAIRDVRGVLANPTQREDWALRLQRRASAYQWPEVARALYRELHLLLRKGQKGGWRKG
ncbi:glycosyltransferase family 4 protein [Candidatus Fermentibacteria bacterium]|nr:glycosyltransferase family 4 protein [Candidatus Fermentibacteria bacterium]